MSTKLRILLIEDSEKDALLLVENLHKGGYQPEYQVVDTAKALQAALDNAQWDIVIVDYSLPGFSGMAALKLISKNNLNIPAIMVSGKMGEETAVEAMRAGAKDYIIKGNYARLVPAIGRELREAVVRKERQAALDELQRSEVRYRAVLEDQTEFINRFSLDGRVTYANPAYARLYGKPPEDLVGMELKDFLSNENYRIVQEIKNNLSKENPITSSESCYVLEHGKEVWLQWLIRLIFDTDGNPVEYQGVGRDITDIKKAKREATNFAENLERNITQLQVAAEIARDATSAYQLDNLLNRAVELICERFGFYHAAVFLIDESGEYAVLTAASGASGKQLLAQKYKLKVGEASIIGHVARNRQPRIALDVSEDALHLKQPLLPDTRSEMAIPLRALDRIIGVLDVQSKQVNAFDDKDLIIFQTMADQLTIGIDNIRLVTETQRRSQELSGLYEAALATSSVLDTNTLIERLYEHIRLLIEPDTFMVALCNPESKTFSVAFAMEKEEPVREFLNKSYSFLEGGLTGWVLENRQPLLIGDIDVDPLPIEPIRGQHSNHAWLGVPLISRSNLIGAVSIQSFQPNAFDDSHKRFLESLVAQSAVALENARLFEAERAARVQAETLRDVAQVVEASLEPKEVVELILRQMKRALTFDSASVLLYKKQGEPDFVSAIGYENPDFVKSQSGKKLEGSRILTQMRGDLQPIIIPDVPRHPDWIWVPGAEHVRSFIGVPVIIREKMIGALMADSRKPNHFREDDLNTAQVLARHMAVAIENANLFDAERIARERAEALRDAAQVVASTLSFNEVIEAVLERLVRVLPSDSASVFLVEGNRVRLQAGRGYEKFTGTEGIAQTAFPLDAPFVQEIVGQGKMQMIPDVLAYSGWVNTPFSAHIRSYLGVPLRVRDQVIGFFSLDRVTRGGFSDDDLEIAELFAAQTSAAIENAYLFEAEEKRVVALEILRQVSLRLTASLEPEAVLDAILDGVFKLIPDVQDAHIFTYDGEQLAFGSSLWQDGHRGEIYSEPRPDGLTYRTARSGETIVVNDFKTNPLFSKQVAKESWEGSIVGIPVKIGNRVVGVLNIAHLKPYAFSEAELHMLRLMSDQAALAMENARLFEQTMMERRHISLLYAVGQASAASLDPDTIVERALELTCQALGGNVGAIWAYQPDENHLSLWMLYAQDFQPIDHLDPEREARIPLGQTLVGWSAQQHQAINIPDVWQDERWTKIDYIDAEIHAMIAAPISDGQQLLGVMTILHQQISAFSNDHLNLLQSICQQVGLALSNAHRYQDINRLVDLLATEQHRLESLIEMLPAGILLIDKDHHLLLSNPLGKAFLSILSDSREDHPLTNLGSIPLADILGPQTHSLPLEISVEAPKRGVYEVQASQIGGDTVQWVLTIRDVTQERENQERVQMQERLATVGQLAAGIAHDFNNIMAAIVVYADLLMMEPSLSDASQERLSIIQQQIQRASSLIRQILDFSRRSIMEQSTLHLLPFMKEMQKLLERTLPETIMFSLDYEPGEYAVLADPTRLQQVFMNLAVNARDAMPNGGQLRFHLANIRLNDENTPPVVEMHPGDWVCVSITDTGVGVSLENQSRIFEPFFTTKSVGQGTGLGLAQVYGIVRQHDGYIDVKSQLGKGTQFDIYLPKILAESGKRDTKDDRGVIDGTGKTVLLVEDDSTTRSALEALLQAQNFQVILASNGTDALEILNRENEKISLVVSDIVMPKMGGIDLYTLMQIRWPEIQILFITGHPINNQSQGVLEHGNVEWLQKPFSIAAFNQAVKKLLEDLQ